MACSEWREKLDLYLDGELPTTEAGTLGTHMRNCAACAAETLERVQIKRTVKIAGKRYEPSAQFRSKVLKSVAAKPRREFSLWWQAATVAALVMLVVGGWSYSNRSREMARQQRVYSELADLHVATLASATPVDVISTDRHTVKPWFQGRIPFTFSLPELQGSTFMLLGGRVTYLAQTPGAHLIYQIRKHEISVFIFPERGTEGLGGTQGAANQLSFNFESWTQNGLRYFVIGDAAAEDIRALRVLLQGAR